MKIKGGDPATEASAFGQSAGEDPAWPCESPPTVEPPTVVDVSGDPGPSPDTAVPFRSVGFSLSSLGYAIARSFRQTLAPIDLEPREFALLRAVGVAEGQSQQAIGERLQIPPSRMVAFVDALEGRLLLERRHNPDDRRTRELYLTAAGRELLTRAFALANGLETSLCAALSTAERDLLLELLQRVSAQLGLAPAVHAAHTHAALARE